MSIYMSRLFPKANSSFSLRSGNAMKAEVVRVRQDTFLVNAGLGSPKFCKADELTGISDNPPIRFENLVGFQGVVPQESLVRKRILERCFIDLVTGEPLMKEQAAARVNDLVGSTEVVPGEPLILLPRKFRQEKAWMELHRIWQKYGRVKGFMLGRTRTGYMVGIAGFVAFLRLQPYSRQKLASDRFTIERINMGKRTLEVFQ